MVTMTSSERAAIKSIEAALGPVGKGHHNSHRTEALLRWLRKNESKDNEANDTPAHEKSESSSERKSEGE